MLVNRGLPNWGTGLRVWLTAAVALLQPDINLNWGQPGEGDAPLIPLKLMETAQELQFVSAIALRLERQCQQPACTLAQAIAQALPAVLEDNDWGEWRSLLSHVEITYRPPGWIFLRLGNESISRWLQWLNSFDWQLFTADTLSLQDTSVDLWELQATHARCCALLRLAERENLIQCQPSAEDAPANPWRIAQPNPIPWLHQNGNLQFQHPAEQRLLIQFVHTLELLSSPDQFSSLKALQKITLKQGYILHQTFQQFDAACRLFDQRQLHTSELAQARLGLVAITRACLWSLLTVLGFPAPEIL